MLRRRLNCLVLKVLKSFLEPTKIYKIWLLSSFSSQMQAVISTKGSRHLLEDQILNPYCRWIRERNPPPKRMFRILRITKTLISTYKTLITTYTYPQKMGLKYVASGCKKICGISLESHILRHFDSTSQCSPLYLHYRHWSHVIPSSWHSRGIFLHYVCRCDDHSQTLRHLLISMSNCRDVLNYCFLLLAASFLRCFLFILFSFYFFSCSKFTIISTKSNHGVFNTFTMNYA